MGGWHNNVKTGAKMKAPGDPRRKPASPGKKVWFAPDNLTVICPPNP